MTRIIAVAAILTLTLTAAASAGLNTDARAVVHVLPHADRACTKNFPAISDCHDIITTEPSPDVDAFPVFFQMVEYAGVEYGLDWPGMYSTVFTSCSDLTVGSIVWPGDGIAHAWTTCQHSTIAVPGWAWIYDYGLICIIPHFETGHIACGDCQGGENPDSIPVGKSCCAGIGGTATGEDACNCVTGPCTWSAVKRMFR
jgi:hypothetical protein